MGNSTLEFYMAMGPKGDPVQRAVVTKAWLKGICDDLGLDPKNVKEIFLTGTMVTVTSYLKDARGSVQTTSDGEILLTQDEYSVCD